jgi:four helix bundle protein
MFDFERLTVYTKAKAFNKEVSKLLKQITVDAATKNQLRRSSLSIVLNIAEGTGRKTNADKTNFLIISRGSVFECVAICDLLKDEEIISKECFGQMYLKAEELSKMLFVMMQRLK